MWTLTERLNAERLGRGVTSALVAVYRALHIKLTRLILRVGVGGKCRCYPHFRDREIKAWRERN